MTDTYLSKSLLIAKWVQMPTSEKVLHSKKEVLTFNPLLKRRSKTSFRIILLSIYFNR
jgi:hypothetical protein